jgi:predicted nucleic acid-binding protein
MIVLDTPIVSELMRDRPRADVLGWLDEQPTRALFVTAVTEAEVLTGIAILPEGRRKRILADAAARAFGGLLSGRVLPFDSAAAQTYSVIAAARRAAGRPISQSDGQIAAIARSRNMAIATRNVRDFEDMGIDLIDPWTST